MLAHSSCTPTDEQVVSASENSVTRCGPGDLIAEGCAAAAATFEDEVTRRCVACLQTLQASLPPPPAGDELTTKAVAHNPLSDAFRSSLGRIVEKCSATLVGIVQDCPARHTSWPQEADVRHPCHCDIVWRTIREVEHSLAFRYGLCDTLFRAPPRKVSRNGSGVERADLYRLQDADGSHRPASCSLARVSPSGSAGAVAASTPWGHGNEYSLSIATVILAARSSTELEHARRAPIVADTGTRGWERRGSDDAAVAGAPLLEGAGEAADANEALETHPDQGEHTRLFECIAAAAPTAPVRLPEGCEPMDDETSTDATESDYGEATGEHTDDEDKLSRRTAPLPSRGAPATADEQGSATVAASEDETARDDCAAVDREIDSSDPQRRKQAPAEPLCSVDRLASVAAELRDSAVSTDSDKESRPPDLTQHPVEVSKQASPLGSLPLPETRGEQPRRSCVRPTEGSPAKGVATGGTHPPFRCSGVSGDDRGDAVPCAGEATWAWAEQPPSRCSKHKAAGMLDVVATLKTVFREVSSGLPYPHGVGQQGGRPAGAIFNSCHRTLFEERGSDIESTTLIGTPGIWSDLTVEEFKKQSRQNQLRASESPRPTSLSRVRMVGGAAQRSKSSRRNPTPDTRGSRSRGTSESGRATASANVDDRRSTPTLLRREIQRPLRAEASATASSASAPFTHQLFSLKPSSKGERTRVGAHETSVPIPARGRGMRPRQECVPKYKWQRADRLRSAGHDSRSVTRAGLAESEKTMKAFLTRMEACASFDDPMENLVASAQGFDRVCHVRGKESVEDFPGPR